MARRALREINAGSMADIAFLLLIFFLVTTTMDVDTGLTRKLPPPLDPEIEPPPVKDRNIFNVLINSRDRLMFEGKEGNIRTLKDKAKEFLSNPFNRENLPEKSFREIEGLGEYPVSKGIISLKNDRGTSYDMYIQVQNELALAVQELRDELSMEKFGTRFDKLFNITQKEAIQKAIPMSISEAEPEDVGGN